MESTTELERTDVGTHWWGWTTVVVRRRVAPLTVVWRRASVDYYPRIAEGSPMFCDQQRGWPKAGESTAREANWRKNVAEGQQVNSAQLVSAFPIVVVPE